MVGWLVGWWFTSRALTQRTPPRGVRGSEGPQQALVFAGADIGLDFQRTATRRDRIVVGREDPRRRALPPQCGQRPARRDETSPPAQVGAREEGPKRNPPVEGRYPSGQRPGQGLPLPRASSRKAGHPPNRRVPEKGVQKEPPRWAATPQGNGQDKGCHPRGPRNRKSRPPTPRGIAQRPPPQPPPPPPPRPPPPGIKLHADAGRAARSQAAAAHRGLVHSMDVPGRRAAPETGAPHRQPARPGPPGEGGRWRGPRPRGGLRPPQ